MLTGTWCSENLLGGRINHLKGDINAAWWAAICCSFAPGQNASLPSVILTSSENRVLRIPGSQFSEKHPRRCGHEEPILLLLVLLQECYLCRGNPVLIWNRSFWVKKSSWLRGLGGSHAFCPFQLLPWKYTVRSFLPAMAASVCIAELTVGWPNGMLTLGAKHMCRG